MCTNLMREIFHIDEDVSDIRGELNFLYYLEMNADRGLKQKGTDIMYRILKETDLAKKWSIHNDVIVENELFPEFKKDLDIKHIEYVAQEINKKDEEMENAIVEEEEKYEKNMYQEFRPQKNFSDFYKLLYLINILYDIASNIEMKKVNENEYKISVYNLVTDFGIGVELAILFNDIYFKIVGYNDDKNNGLQIEVSQRFLKTVLKNLLNKNEWNLQDGLYLVYTLQFVTFVQCLANEQLEEGKIFHNTSLSTAVFAAEIFYQKDLYKEGIRFAKLALNVNEPMQRRDAYNILGICAIDDNQFQLAYDSFFSWINKKIVLEVENVEILEKEINSKEEKLWRINNEEEVAIMYSNFAYVCGKMYDLLKKHEQYVELMLLAEYYIKYAIRLGGAGSRGTCYYCSAGTIMSDAGKIEEAISFYEEYKRRVKGNTNKLNSSRSLIIEYRQLLSAKEKDRETHSAVINELMVKLNKEIDEFVKYYQESDKGEYKDLETIEELKYCRNIYSLVSQCQGISKEREKVRCLLMQIDRDVFNILKRLKRNSYYDYNFKLHIDLMTEEVQAILVAKKEELIESILSECPERFENSEVAYYTSLSNVQFLFKEVLRGQKGDKGEIDRIEGKNCFTMMHAKYMNDPEEGLILLQELQDYLPNTPSQMRDELYDQKYVFIRSFTGLIDQLNMWTLYGSDKTSGKDCNGCCVCFAPETFEIVVNRCESSNNESAQMTFREDDDYHLYSIAYIDGDRIIVDGKEDEIIKIYFEELKNRLADLKKETRYSLDRDKKIVTSCLVILFEKLMFLFKDNSYRLEEESRLIITRDIWDKEEIQMTEQIPPKLYINPFYQIYPEKIILGPKVEDADFWVPHLQYELARFKDKWGKNRKRNYKPVVRKSEINIR